MVPRHACERNPTRRQAKFWRNAELECLKMAGYAMEHCLTWYEFRPLDGSLF